MGLKELKERALKDPAVKKEYDKLEEEFKAYDETAYLLRSKKNASRLLASIAELENGLGKKKPIQ